MTTGLEEKLYTPEDLLKIDGDHRYELLDGRLVEKFMGAKASWIATRLLTRIERHAVTHHPGLVFDAECGYEIFPNCPRVRKPDGSFIRKGRLPNDEPPDGHVRIPPDLAFEVISPNELAKDFDKKVEEYLQAGIRLLWVIFPDTRRIYVFRHDGTVSRLSESDELQGEDVLPGFTCRVADLFIVI